MANVLIVDDNPCDRALMIRLVEKGGYRALSAPNGIEGLRIFHNIAIDAVITDIIMPEKDGFEVIRALRSSHPHVKIIAVSGGGHLSADHYLRMAGKMGAARTLCKPLVRDELLSALKEMLI